MSFDSLRYLEGRPGMFGYQWHRGPVRVKLRPMCDLRGYEPRHQPNYVEIARAAIAKADADSGQSQEHAPADCKLTTAAECGTDLTV